MSRSGFRRAVRRPTCSARSSRPRLPGLQTVALTGRDGGAIGTAAAIHINVPETSTARVQEVHMTVIHAICALVEQALEPRSRTGIEDEELRVER